MDADTEVQPIKRIVLIQRAGPLAGLWHIIGTDEQFQDALPMYVDGVRYPDGHSSSADYFKSTDRAHIYQERV
jgi:hypothetical protein